MAARLGELARGRAAGAARGRAPRPVRGRRRRRIGHHHPVSQTGGGSRTCSSAWATPWPRAPRSRPTGTTSRPSTCPRATRPAACGTRSTSRSASPSTRRCCAPTPRRCRSARCWPRSRRSTSSPRVGPSGSDTADATHLPVFHQIEGLVIDRGITFADLAGTIETFVKALFGDDRTHPAAARRTSPSPSRRPSSTCRRPTAAGSSWAAAAWSTPTCWRNCGSTPRSGAGFAFGFGIDRIAKERHGIDDLREFVANDVRFLPSSDRCSKVRR